MRIIDLDQVADRLMTSSRTSSLTKEHVAQLRDVILWTAALDVLDTLGGTISILTIRRLREQYGDGTGLRRLAGSSTVEHDLGQRVAALIRQALATYPTFTLGAIHGTRHVTELVAMVAGADKDYTPPVDLLDLLCVVAGLAMCKPSGSKTPDGGEILRRVWDEAAHAALSLPAY